MRVIRVLALSFLTFSASAQEYSQMPPAVQQKMDDNKVSGVDMYNGVISTYDVDLIGLEGDDVQVFRNKIAEDLRVKDFSLSTDGKKLLLTARGQYTIKDIKSYVVVTSAAIENYSVVYSVEEN